MNLKIIRLWLTTSLLFVIADILFSWNPLAAVPYLAHRHETVFRASPLLAHGLWIEALNGLIAALSYRLLESALQGSVWRRGALFGLVMWGFWVVSGTLSAYVWLDIPTSVALGNTLFGLPKCVFIGCGMSRLENRVKKTRI